MSSNCLIVRLGIAAAILAMVGASLGQEKTPSPASLIGRWDVTVHGSGGDYPSWFEISRSGRKTLVGAYVGQFGSVRPVSRVEFADGRFRFTVPPQWEGRTDDITYEGRVDRDILRGDVTDDAGKRIPWEARRAPALKRAHEPKWGEPVELFNGHDLDGWKPQLASVKNGWTVKDGLLVNAVPGNNLLTERKFTDFKIVTEFRYAKGSNSGVYLRGRYEVQIEDDFGQEPDSHKIGGIYGFLTPRLNAARKAGEWQTLEVTLVGREVTVTLNGERIIERQSIPGITGGALDSNEGEPGPILLQGDHGPIDFRKVTLTPGVGP
jgi:Domain of Unknown Function (DUF1080)